MIWVNMAVPVIKIDKCMFRHMSLDMTPIGFSVVIIY